MMGVGSLVLALITNVVVSLGLFCGVQPSNRLSSGPTVAPFGLQAWSRTTPVFLAGLKAPWTAVGAVGSVTSRPPSQVIGPARCPELQPVGLWATIGSDV